MRKIKRRNEKEEKPIYRNVKISGVEDLNKLYAYNVVSNKAKKVKTQCIRFYQKDGDYIEIEVENDYVVLRSSGRNLNRLNIHPVASNCCNIKAAVFSLGEF